MVSKAFYIIAIVSLGASLGVAQNEAYLEYIEQNKTLAVSEMERTGIPASIKMAQALLESNAGRSELARKANNHFGIKCGGDWTGKTYKKKDDDRNLLGMRVKSCFRHFRSIQESFIAHSELLRTPNRQSRYSFLFDLDPRDYKAWARGLKKAGYATSNSYHRKLINLIEQYDLHKLDYMTTAEMVASNSDRKKEQPENQERRDRESTNPPASPATSKAEKVESVKTDYHNDVKYIVSPNRESVAEIAGLAGVTVDEVLKYNESLRSAQQVIPADVRVYLQPKRKRFRGRKTWHKVQSGESMLDISNKYAIDLQRLYERNQLEKGQEPVPGAEIKLSGGTVDLRPELRSSSPPTVEERPEKIIIEDEDVETLNMEIEWNGGKPKKEKADTNRTANDPSSQIPVTGKTPPAATASGSSGVGATPSGEPFGNSKESVADSDQQWYTVQRGDTLWRIAQIHGTSVDRIKALNQLNSNYIRSGIQLKVR